MKLEFPLLNGANWDWYQLASENYVDSKVFDINFNTSGILDINRLNGYPSNSNLFLRGDGSWATPTGGGMVELTGAVTGSGVETINTVLNSVQNFTDKESLQFNWSKPPRALNPFDYRVIHNLTGGVLDFVQDVQTTNAQGYRSFFNHYDFNANEFTIGFADSSISKIGLSIRNVDFSSIIATSLKGDVVSIEGGDSIVLLSDNPIIVSNDIDLIQHSIINLTNSTDPLSAVNKQYADSLITPQLSALSTLATTGLIARTAANTFATRSITVGTGLSISNANGVLGNPTVSLSTQLQNLHNLNTLGFVSLITTGSGISTFANRTLTPGTGIAITNTNGVSNNPTISVSNIPISSLTNFPSVNSLYLDGSGFWTNPLGYLDVTDNTISAVVNGNIQFGNPVFMNENSLYLRGNQNFNYGILYSTSLSGVTEFRGFSGFTWKTGTDGVTERMRLTTSSLDLFSNNITTSGIINATTGTLRGNNLSSFSGSINVGSALACGSNNITTSGTINATTGSLKANNLYAHNSSSITCDALNVIEYYSPYSGSYGYLSSSGGTGTSSGTNGYSINCTYRVKASEFNAVSSIKKKNILAGGVDVEQEVIDIIQRTEFFKYEYKDQITEKGIRYGIIAEELAKTLPDYVDCTNMEYLPNIMQKGELRLIKGSKYQYIVKLTNKIEASIENNKLKLVNAQNKIVEVEIIDIIDAKSLKINSQQELSQEMYVYGTYEKCPSVASKATELALIAVKNILTRLEKLEYKNNDQK